MRYLFIVLLISLHVSIFAQAKKKAPVKFYFAKSTFDDSVALKMSLPKLAAEILVSYDDKDRSTYLDNALRFHVVAGNYKRVIGMVDSLRMLSSNASLAIHYKSYSIAKAQAVIDPTSFRKSYEKAFSGELHTSSNKTYVNNIFSDESLKRTQSTWDQFVAKLKAEKPDSINYKDALLLCRYYTSLININKKIKSIVSPLLNSPGFQKELQEEDNRQYPVVKSVRWANAVPIPAANEVPDAKLSYKLLMDMSSFAQKEDTSASREINFALGAVGRILNLHVAAGVPKKNIDLVIVAHASGIYPFFDNEKYKAKYGVDNPNLKTIKELTDFGVKIIACGQTMYYQNIRKEDLLPEVKISMTAQTALSSYQLKNYVLYDLSAD